MSDANTLPHFSETIERRFHASRPNLSGESLLWSHIQQVCRREEDIGRRLSSSAQLQDLVSKPNYKVVLSRNLDQALNSLLDVFFERDVEDLQHRVTVALGNIALTLAYDAYPFFQWIIRQFQTIANDTVRNYLLKSLTEALRGDLHYRYFGKMMGMVVGELQVLLESVDIPEHLPVCIDPLLLISQSYPETFFKHFRDIVDILVGWHIDHSQDISLIMYCAGALQSLHPHWQNDLDFSLTLLNQFLEDMEAYAEGIDKLHCDESVVSVSEHPESLLQKSAALLRAFSTVVRSIGPLFHANDGTSIAESFILELLQRIIVCAQLVGNLSFTATCAANECMQLLIAAVHWKGEEMLSESLLTYVVHGIEKSNSEARLVLALKLVIVMVQEIGSALPPWFVVGLLGPSSRLLPLKYGRNSKVTSELLALYQACLSVRNVSLLQIAYRNVLGELQFALNYLLKSCDTVAPPLQIFKEDIFTDVNSHTTFDGFFKGKPSRKSREGWLLRTALFDITALSEVADAKNSIIGMFALSPSIFDLLHSELHIVHGELATLFPQIQYMVLCTLYSHCQRHKNFLSTYMGGSMTQSPVSTSSSASAVTNMTQHHFPQVLTLISKLLLRKVTSAISRTLLLHWVEEILNNLMEFREVWHVIAETKFQDMLKSLAVLGTHQTEANTSTIMQCFSNVFIMAESQAVAPLSNDSVYRIGLELIVAHIFNTNTQLQKNCFELMKKVPVDEIERYCSSSCWHGTMQRISKLARVTTHDPDAVAIRSYNQDGGHVFQPLEALNIRRHWLAKRGHMMKVLAQESAFYSHHFQSIMDLLLNGHFFDNSSRLERIFWSCQQSGLEPISCQDTSIHRSYHFIVWWALWECALFTVSNKLRTPLGRPQDTFQKIEGALREYDQQQSAGPQLLKSSKKSYGDSSSFNPERKFQNQIQGVMQRPHLLLQFLFSLEKLMFNAYSGCVSIAAPNKAVRTFFSTNRQTCEQWLNRLRLAAMKVALSCGLYPTAVYHGQKILEDMKVNNNTQGAEFDQAIFMSVEALLGLRSSQTIAGLYKFCREVSKTQTPSPTAATIKQVWSWMKAARNQASSRFEDAIKEYEPIFNNLTQAQKDEEQPSNVKREAKSFFLAKQISNCYLALGDWKEALKWVKNGSGFAQESEKGFPNIEFAEALSSFEDEKFKQAEEKGRAVLTGISSKDKETTFAKDGLSSWKWPDLLTASDIHLLRFLMNNNDANSSSLKKVKIVAESAIQIFANYWPINAENHFLSLFAISNWIDSDEINPPPVEIFKDPMWFPASERMIRFLTSDYMSKANKVNAENLFELTLSSCKMHRKLGNFNTCTRLFKRIINTTSHNEENGHFDPEDIGAVVDMCHKLGGRDYNHIWDIKFELSKEMVAVGKKTEGICLMADTLLESLQENNNGVKSASMLLSLSKNLQSEWKTVGSSLQRIMGGTESESGNDDIASKFELLLHHEKIVPSFKHFSGDEQLMTEANADVLLGTFLHSATREDPELAKAWFHSAGWCYKWGRKIVDSASNSGNFSLTDGEKRQVDEILKQHDAIPEKLDQIHHILSQVHCTGVIHQEDDILTQQQDSKDDNMDVIRKQLLTCCDGWLQQLPGYVTENLLKVWQSIRMRPFHLYRAAADSYFQFLRLNLTQQAKVHEDCIVTTTLRLLRLLAKHALELQSALECGLKNTPTTPWNGIIPQLFSRLNHPEVYVRQSISDLLCRIARNTAHLVVYPVVVATTHVDKRSRSLFHSSTQDDDMKDGEESFANASMQADASFKLGEEDPPLQQSGEDIQTESYVNACYHKVLDALKEHNEDMIKDIQLLVWELRRITLLWDELWLGTLNQHHQDIMKRLHQLHDEAKRVNSNHSLTRDEKNTILKEQQQAVMRPIVYSLRRVQRITGATPETPHEQWFSENMQPLVDQAMKRLTEPPNPQNPNSCWSGFKQLHFQLTSRASKRTSQVLNLSQISPKLMGLNATSMPIPGVSVGDNQVTIQGCSSVVSILPTKTKPKKLQFIGSNCQRFTFLFKGLEDLHLDERIMQFLFIANQLLRKHHKSSGYAARHYSVTPLGSRSGLIQWVDGATPLFTLYKKWQQRQAILNTTDANQIPKPILRPSIIYYNKMNPALKKAGVDIDKVSRKEWPAEVLRDVLNELVAETPPDLLQRELWCTSTSATKLWDVQQKYSCSTAVMSMIGYVIGLGDRHMDNVLIDLESGEVVHIDYNVCFDKGMQLRVPEKVPFRLTQNVKAALGLTSVEGVFRYVCEQVISTLRKGRETLLTLLEAFVYDPLVDWTGTIEGGYAGAVYGGGGQGDAAPLTKLSRHDMEREISKSLFSSRVAEMKPGWLENQTGLEKALSNSIEELHRYKKHFASHVDISEKIKNLLEMKGEVKTAQTGLQHPLRSLKQRWTQHRAQTTKKEFAKRALQEKINLCDANVQKYKAFLGMLQTPELAGLLNDVSLPLHFGEPIYQSATSFLNAAGQAAMVTQAQVTEKELVSLSEQCRLTQHSCIETLTTFAAITAQFPPTAVIANHSNAIWASHLSQLARKFTEENCAAIQSSVKKQMSREVRLSQARMAAAKDTMLQQEVNDLNKLLIKLVERRNGQLSAQGQDWTNLENTVAVTRECIISFVQENSVFGMQTTMSILTLALSALAQRGITMESTAATAGHRLVDMTSQDGDWFLEELCSLFGNVVQLLHVGDQILALFEMGPSLNLDAVQAVFNVDSCFRSLMDLHNNFRNIILPEAVKLLQCEEPSVIEMVNEFNALVQREKLDDMAKQLSAALRSSGDVTSCADALSAVENIQKQYSQLLHDARQEEHRLLAGQMLLQGFDGLFRTTHSGFLDLITVHSSLMEALQPQWVKLIDILQKPDSLQKMKYVTSTKKTILQALLFVKQIQSMHDFFVLCQSNARSFVIERHTGISGSYHTSSKTLYSEERLMKPVKHFIAHFVQDLMIGVPTQLLGLVLCNYMAILGVDIDTEINASMGRTTVMIETVCKRIIDEKYSQATLTKQKMLIYQFNKSWKDLDKAQRLDSNITAVRASLQRSKLQHTRFQWLHEDILMETSSVKFNPPRRMDVIVDLQKRVQAMQQLGRLLQQIQETATTQNKSILQRLKWAAGANPSLQSVLQDVEKTMQNRSIIMQNETALSQKVAELCQTAVAFEESRIQTRESAKGDSDATLTRQSLETLKSCQETCREMSNTKVNISKLEETLMKVVLESSDKATLRDDWLLKAVDTLNTSTTQLRQVRQQEEVKMQGVKTKLLSISNTIKQLVVTQSRLMSDMKSLLKALAKDDKSETRSESTTAVRQFLDDYKSFCTNLSDTINSLLQSCEATVVPDPDPLIVRLSEMAQSVSWIYGRLLILGSLVPEDKDDVFVSTVKDENKPSRLKSGPDQAEEKVLTDTSRAEQASLPSSAAKASSKKKQDPRTGKAVQERNYFAVSVWRQVKAKLDGRDVDFSRRMQISEQVDYVINEATSADNLALMYEGWTAWV